MTLGMRHFAVKKVINEEDGWPEDKVAPKKRGRPPKVKPIEEVEPVKKPRGRPKKVVSVDKVEEPVVTLDTPKKRGRPKKVVAETVEASPTIVIPEVTVVAPKRRGRPPKAASVEPAVTEPIVKPKSIRAKKAVSVDDIKVIEVKEKKPRGRPPKPKVDIDKVTAAMERKVLKEELKE